MIKTKKLNLFFFFLLQKKNSLPQRQPRRHGHAPRLRPVHEHRPRRRRGRQDEDGHRDGGESRVFLNLFSHFLRPFDLDDLDKVRKNKKLTLSLAASI